MPQREEDPPGPRACVPSHCRAAVPVKGGGGHSITVVPGRAGQQRFRPVAGSGPVSLGLPPAVASWAV